MARKLAIAGLLLAAVAFVSPMATAGPECRCRLFGEKVAIGTVSCIEGKLMQCLMFQNTPSWKVLGDICPIAKQSVPPPTNRGKPSERASAS